MTWKLKRTAQCQKCPWRKEVDPHDIPHGYSEDRHANLAGTIVDPDPVVQLRSMNADLRIMACHETHDAHCIGWLENQLGPGTNIMLRMSMRECENYSKVRLRGEQHATFADTMPKKLPQSAVNKADEDQSPTEGK